VRRKSPRVVWLPPTDTNSPTENPELGIQTFSLDISMSAPSVSGEVPLTIDSQDDPLDPNTSLADIESTGYRLRRIVGKIWVIGDNDDEESGINIIVITAGIIVRRSDPVTGISFAETIAQDSLLNPLKIPNFGDPWIWRRSWILRGQADSQFATQLPTSNTGEEVGSALDGPHVDQKTARIVGPEERVFLTVSANVVNGSGQGEINNQTRIVSELRLLASMRTSSGNRRNASR